MLAEHQRDAVRRAHDVIDRCGGVLLADEPGLGKSFIAAELARCEEARGADVEVLVPAALVGQWNETLRRFGVSARIATHDGIVSDPRVASPGRRFIVVDEAHAFRNPKTQRYDALARRSAGARMLLVTATPLCNSTSDLRALVKLIVADDACDGVPSIEVAFDRGDVRDVIAQLVIRRDRQVLPPELQFGNLDARVIRYGVPDVHEVIDALRFPLVGESAILRQFLWRRLESSDAALFESLRRQRRFYERALECLASGRTLPKREYRRAFAHDEDAADMQQVLFWELFVAGGETAHGREIEAEVARIDALRSVVAASPRSKLQMLRDALDDEPALIFTGWTATAKSIGDALGAGVATGRNRAAIDAFQSGRIDVLVATDIGAEGLNLQRAGVVVHYDLPWNPVKIDQRNGRALRIGQTRESVRAIYFLPDGDRSRVMNVVARKNAMRRRTLRPSEGGGKPPHSTMRPRITKDAAVAQLARRISVPDELCRTHKAGVERLIAALSDEYLDERKLQDLRDLLAYEPRIIRAWTS